jgi:hypothetical protein
MQQVIENRHDHRILGSEMARKVRWRYIGGSSDLIDGRGVIPLARAELQSGIDQPLAAVLMPIFRDLCSLLRKSTPKPQLKLAGECVYRYRKIQHIE